MYVGAEKGIGNGDVGSMVYETTDYGNVWGFWWILLENCRINICCTADVIPRVRVMDMGSRKHLCLVHI